MKRDAALPGWDAGLATARAMPGLRWAPLVRRLGGIVSHAWLWLVVAFIYAPILVVVGASFDPGKMLQLRAFLQFPPQGFTLRWYTEIGAPLWASLWLSLKLGVLVAAAAGLLGVPAALGLVRGRFPGKAVVASVFRAPLQIPFIVISIAFLQSYFAIAAALGITLQGSLTGLFLGHLFVAVPYVVGSVGASLQRIGPRVEEAALSLGASPWRVLLRVTLPLVVPGICGGLLYAFLISFTDVTIAVFLAGSDTVPFPVRIFSAVTTDMEPTIPAISTLVFLASILLVYGMQRLLGMDALLRSSGSSG